VVVTAAMATTAPREHDSEDQCALLEREDTDDSAADAQEPGARAEASSVHAGLPHASLSVELASIEEHKSEFTLTGRASFLWRSDGVLGGGAWPTELQGQLYPDLSSDAQSRCCELIEQMLQLLRNVIAEPGSGSSADKYHPRQPIAQMEIKDESHFYEYRVSALPCSLDRQHSWAPHDVAQAATRTLKLTLRSAALIHLRLLLRYWIRAGKRYTL
jgi:hypothetical protein